jgi:HEAT repeat protein
MQFVRLPVQNIKIRGHKEEKAMIHYFCPFCWNEISKDEKTCPLCSGNIEEWDEKGFTEKLIDSLNHSERSTVYRACYILGEMRERVSIKPLIDLLNKTNDYFLMEEIVEALGKIGDERAVPFLIKMLNNRSFLVRGKAAAVLSNFDDQEEVVEALKRAIGDHSHYVRELASASLNKLTATLKRCRV